jgi:hypothetical protein
VSFSVFARFFFFDFCKPRYQTEVALLSRRINLVGEQTNDQFGAHLMVTGNSGLAQVSGVGCDNCGQLVSEKRRLIDSVG